MLEDMFRTPNLQGQQEIQATRQGLPKTVQKYTYMRARTLSHTRPKQRRCEREKKDFHIDR
jgi:hypothetical protein